MPMAGEKLESQATGSVAQFFEPVQGKKWIYFNG
jgi:hypothetical protein